MLSLIKLCLITVALCFVNDIIHAQPNLKIESYGAGTSKYWLIYADKDSLITNQLIVFLHGFGASNPACYGGWIRSLVEAGNIVLFPKFQNGIFLPQTTKFSNRVNKSITNAIANIQEKHKITIKSLAFVSHSIGGVIATNLADEYGKTKKQKVSTLFLVQPGHKYLKLGSKNSYHNIDSNVKVVIITGDKDRTAGDKFAKGFYNTTPQIPRSQKLFLNQYKDKYESEKIGATHVEPISPDSELDTGNKNIIIIGVLLLGKINQVDTNCYWRLSNLLIHCSTGANSNCDSLFQDVDNVTFMGKWANKKRIRPMEMMDGKQ